MPRGKPFEKGNKAATNRGPNKVTTEIKEAYKLLIEANIPNLTLWLERVAEEDPKEALKYLAALSEYVVPKLARTEIQADVEVTTLKQLVIEPASQKNKG